jgi:hypothetical protein
VSTYECERIGRNNWQAERIGEGERKRVVGYKIRTACLEE